MVERLRPKRRIMRTFKINEISAVDNPAQVHARAVIMKRADDPDYEDYAKRQFSANERKKLSESGAALPDGSYPIKTRADLANAVQSFGRAGNKTQVKRHIVARARALGAVDALPEDWGISKVEKKYKSVSELPPAVKDNLPAAAQRQFLAVVNSAMDGGASDSSAFQQAWGALRNAGWKKDAKGTWMKKSDDVEKEYVDAVSAANQGVQALDFDAVLAEQEAQEAAREIGDEMREKWCALQRSFLTIANDDEVPAPEKVARMQASLQQYIDSLAEQSTDIAEAMSKSMSADPALAELLEKSEEGDDEMNAAVRKQLDELQETVKKLAAQVGKTEGDDAKADLAKQLVAVQESIDAIVAKSAEDDAERAELVVKAGMSDDEKAYMDKMSDGDRKDFMAMSPEDRKKKMSKAADADPVVYKAKDGTEFRKSAGDHVIALAKRADDADARTVEEIRKREDAEFAKRADDELKYFSEDVAKRDDKIAVLRAISRMEDGPRAALEKMLEVGGKAVSAAFQTIGHQAGEVAKSAEAFEKRVSEVQTRDKCTRTQAMEKAAREHPDEYEAYREAN